MSKIGSLEIVLSHKTINDRLYSCRFLLKHLVVAILGILQLGKFVSSLASQMRSQAFFFFFNNLKGARYVTLK